ncbi:hypothetical protein M5689_020822 [Euphorbia peplus]|nr:hypothetical protein M5689_020822 [Euphorbia peplus]
MDKKWMQCDDRLSYLYIKGVMDFLEFAFSHTKIEGVIPCPCTKCNNFQQKTRDEVWGDLMTNGIVKGYVKWLYHGESVTRDQNIDIEVMQTNDGDEIFDMIHDVAGPTIMGTILQDENDQETCKKNLNSIELELEEPIPQYEPNDEASKFLKLLEDAKQKLYPGCENFSKLSFVVKMFQIKCLHGLSDTSFNSIMKLFKEALPTGETLPANFYETKKMIRALGLGYKKIHACENDCMLFWKENSKAESCLVCGESRWKNISNSSNVAKLSKRGKCIPRKVLRYFPLKPRLQRLFMSSKTAEDMTWHHNQRVKDKILRHPADSDLWISFDESNPEFAKDPRNVRLGLASDGMNPFGNLSVSHSTWPVIVTIYNLPPWLCMKEPYCLLSLLIPGPKSPGNDIDVYLQPLVEELQELWYYGADTYDAARKENFCMRAALLWTINDFPAYAYLSGWSTKGAMACPPCNKDTPSIRLKHGRKFAYMSARRFLPINHPWRKIKRWFNGQVEKRCAPEVLSGEDVLVQLSALKPTTFGKFKTKKRRHKDDTGLNWRKQAIFFKLPYWKKNLLCHNIDVMHTEKNICDNIIGTLLDIEGKTKDGLNARRDLKELGIRSDLHPTCTNGKWSWPAASYNLSLEEKRKVCKFLKTVKVPDGYSSNISRCVNLKGCKISGLKSHDSHILLEQLLPLAIRGVVPNDVYNAITELCIYFRELCSKVLRKDVLERLELQIPITLCKLEKIFPPAFFDVMVHLAVHLATEAKLAGPIQYRWMYPIERFLRKLKCYVRNKSRPEGSIAEGYIVEESLIFCSSEHEQEGHNMDFDEWFQKRIVQLHQERDARVNEELLSLAHGPLQGIQTFKGYVINGFRFHIKELETKRLRQNSGVLVKGVMNDKTIDYYGVLKEIVELQYLTGKRIVLFKCDWWDVDHVGRGVKVDKHGFCSVNTTRKLTTDEPFVLASQVEQVFYVEDGLTPNWLVVLKGRSEHFVDLPVYNTENNGEVLVQEEAFQQDNPCTLENFGSQFEEDEGETSWNRVDIGGFHVNNNTFDEHVIEPIDSDPETDDEDLIL